MHNEGQGLPEINQPDIGQVASGERLVESLTDDEKYEYLTQRCTISTFATYKVTKCGKEVILSFQSMSLEEYEWLTYSPSCGGRYCKYCVLFAKLTKGFLGVLVKTPFKLKQCNKAKGKDGYLSTHGSLQYHHDAIIAVKAFLKHFNQPDHRIENIIEKKRKETSERNKHILCTIVECIKLCGMHDIPHVKQKGHSLLYVVLKRTSGQL